MSTGPVEVPPAQKRKPAPKGRPFEEGNKANPGGRPKALQDIERMLNAEHRTAENMRPVFAKLKELSLRGEKGDAAYMKLYLERTIGPVKDVDIDLSDAPDEVVTWLKEKLQ